MSKYSRKGVHSPGAVGFATGSSQDSYGDGPIGSLQKRCEIDGQCRRDPDQDCEGCPLLATL